MMFEVSSDLTDLCLILPCEEVRTQICQERFGYSFLIFTVIFYYNSGVDQWSM